MARNRYGGRCYKCGLWVEPDTGHFEKRKGAAGFRVQHAIVPGDGRVTCETAKADAADNDGMISLQDRA